MADSLKAVFTPEAIVRLEAHAGPDHPLQERQSAQSMLKMLVVRGGERRTRESHLLRATRAAWESYLDAALAGGLLEGRGGKDRLERFRQGHPDQIWAALAECMAYWYFAGHLGFRVAPIEPGQAKTPDFALTLPDGSEVAIEVKAPISLSGDDGFNIVGYAQIAAKRMQGAIPQFSRDAANLLVLVPRFTWPLWTARSELVSAFYAQEVLRSNYDPELGEMIGPMRLEVATNGLFLRRREQGSPPAYRRNRRQSLRS